MELWYGTLQKPFLSLIRPLYHTLMETLKGALNALKAHTLFMFKAPVLCGLEFWGLQLIWGIGIRCFRVVLVEVWAWGSSLRLRGSQRLGLEIQAL